jgi:hypothetical protein
MISGLSGAIGCFNLLTTTIDNYPKDQGIIQYVLLNRSPAFIKVGNGKYNDKYYYMYGSKQSDVVTENIKKGKYAIIWYNKNNRIVQLIIDGKVVIPFSKSILISIILILFGLFLFIGNLIYIINVKKYRKIYYEKVKKKGNNK